MLIRTMDPEDRDAVFSMMREFYDSPAVLFTSPDEILKKDIEDCLSALPFVEGVVFEEQGELAGYSMLARSYTTEYGGVCIWVEDLYLKPAFRHSGFSAQFFAWLEERFPEAVRFKLEVEEENVNAEEAYRKNGFTRSGYHLMTKEFMV